MDINTLRVAVTVVSFVTFIGIALWAYSRGPRKGFAEAAQLPFLDDDGHERGGAEARR